MINNNINFQQNGEEYSEMLNENNNNNNICINVDSNDNNSDDGLLLSKRKWKLNKKQWKYLLVDQALLHFVFNVGLNFFVTWIVFPKNKGYYIPFIKFSNHCIFFEIIMASLFLPLFSCLIGSFFINLQLKKGKIDPIDNLNLKDYVFINKIPSGVYWKNILKRSLAFMIVGSILTAPISLLVLYFLVGETGILLQWNFCTFKGLWCGIYSAILSPLSAIIILSSFDPKESIFDKDSNISIKGQLIKEPKR